MARDSLIEGTDRSFLVGPDLSRLDVNPAAARVEGDHPGLDRVPQRWRRHDRAVPGFTKLYVPENAWKNATHSLALSRTSPDMRQGAER